MCVSQMASITLNTLLNITDEAQHYPLQHTLWDVFNILCYAERYVTQNLLETTVLYKISVARWCIASIQLITNLMHFLNAII